MPIQLPDEDLPGDDDVAGLLGDPSLSHLVDGPGLLDSELDAAFGEEADDEFAAIPATESEDDAQIAKYVARAASTSGREHLSALSALSQQMERYRPLTPEEQTERLAAYNGGALADAKLLSGKYSAREERSLRVDSRRGKSAQAELIGSMFRLVLIIAREIAADRYGRERALDILPDLVAEANVSLVKAVTTYDPAKCPTFSIYAGRVIRDGVRMSLQKSSPVGVAPSWLRLKRIYTVLRPEIEMKLGRNPTDAEIQHELRIVCMRWAADRLTDDQKQLPEPQRLAIMESKLRKQGMLGAIDRLQEVLSATHQVGSLDTPLGEEGGTSLGDLLPNVSAAQDFDRIEHQELHRDLMKSLAGLADREREIVMYRFGFTDGEQWTYAKLAPLYNVSAERVRQIERNALGKLGGPAFSGLSSHLPSRAGTDPETPDEPAANRRRRPFSR